MKRRASVSHIVYPLHGSKLCAYCRRPVLYVEDEPGRQAGHWRHAPGRPPLSTSR